MFSPPISSSSSARERILLTAHKLFYLEGIRATGINRLIEESGVTKVTFYRHFPSKNDLILAFLAYRHQLWINWFKGALQRHGGNIGAIGPTLAEWFHNANFRGCAFINGVTELGEELLEVSTIARNHKLEMTAALIALMPPEQEELAQAVAMAIDGAIVKAQVDGDPEMALLILNKILESLQR